MREIRAAVDRRAIELARRQHGVVTGAQLQAIGLSHDAIRRRVARGHLRRVHRGVYVVGPLEAPLTAATAALLACGEGAVLSGRTAAGLWGLLARADGPIEVLARRAATRPGLEVRSTSSLDARDTTRRQGLPVTTPARTLLDVATRLTAAQLDRAIEQAQVLHGVTERALAELLVRHRGHRGASRLRATLPRQREPDLTRSEAERRLLEIVRTAGLPAPAANVRVEGIEVDALWRSQRLVVEVDGYAFHRTRQAFERDRRRDARLQAAGYRVLRLTWRRIVDEPLAVVAQLAALLRQ
jgi:very-short-patch-repair endonuclease